MSAVKVIESVPSVCSLLLSWLKVKVKHVCHIETALRVDGASVLGLSGPYANPD